MRALRLALVVCLVPLFTLSCGDDGNSADSSDDDGPKPACMDGMDNDGDGKTDYPDNLECDFSSDDSEEGLAKPQCSDGRDNDGDGKFDFPDDPGCYNPQHDLEMDDCPDGVHCPQCGNGRDDDMNGTMDYPGDPGCEAAVDNTEFINNPNACGVSIKIEQLPGDGIVMGTLDDTSITSLTSQCSNAAGAPALAYVFQLTEPKVVVASTDDAGTSFDSVLSIRGSSCMTDLLACNNDVATGNLKSRVEMPLDPGTYYLIVQGFDASEQGSFRLQVDRYAGEGANCTTQNDCGPGLTCRIPAGETTMQCSQPVCGDGRDDDGDGKIDFPNDPGCASALGTSETDDCPTGPNCPECADGMDNDNDTKVDFPMDTTCQAASNDSESCPTSEGVTSLTLPITMGSLAMATDDVAHPAACSAGGSGRDITYRLDLPQLSSLSFNTTGASVITSLLDSTCGGTALQCSAAAGLTRPNVAAGTYYFVVDGKTTAATGAYTVSVSGKIANNTSCESPLVASGALTCDVGYACKGTAGSRTCQTAQCNDMMDNNGNNKTDYPNDPGCTDRSDDTETTVCPGASCPACGDGMDNDMDGQTDYPADVSCQAASGTNESCVTTEGVTPITMMNTPGTTVGATNDSTPTCSSTTGMAPDRMYEIKLPATTTVSINVTGLDTITSLFNSTCTGTPLKCGDAQNLTMTGLAAGTYYFLVDGYFATPGTYTINVSGKIADGSSCENPLALAGALTCANPAFVCGGAVGSRTCRAPQCNDGIDNNGAGGIDFPNDPGCMSALDATEDTVVCPGASCPQCANTVDDDTDTLVDYPADFGCAGRGSNTEAFCSTDPDFGGVITMPLTQGTLATAVDNSTPTCQSISEGNDRVFALQLPVAVASLQIDTIGSAVDDTEVELRDAACGTSFGCDDDGDPAGFLSLLTVTNVAAGNYAIVVDAYSSDSNGGFNLNVKGTVAPMTSCTSPLFGAGVLVCPSGTTCTGNPMKCQ